ncbi:MAG: UvrB/UvrC motif-containing protein [Candidatus Pacebacteria bacterium]|nr:UvrB/UvrC motif-containing protein [Candidatus Paceibacterota bacterium]MBP9831903.1 UvrB/UvrC motif-containing protein [Candidatus Paceibacterota bacterium]
MEKKDLDFSKIPDTPGIYIFRKGKKILYIGKATSLRSRVRSYFVDAIADIRSPLIAKIVADAGVVIWEGTDSVLEAFLLESKRIKEYQPVGNTDAKDNKSFNYLVVTNETFPRFLVVRERELTSKFSPSLIKHLFGPFPSGAMLKSALKIIRRIFPFFDTKFPLDGHLSPANDKTFHFNQSIGLYPRELNEDEYKKTVRNIVLLFEAKKSTLLKTLEREMMRSAKAEDFEEAEKLKRQVFALKHIQDISLVKEELRAPDSSEFRIEAYDTAHIRGSAPRGVMSVIVDGEAVPAEYRTFTIRDAKAGDDFAALTEIITRRANHPEWPFPKLVVIDGGKTHLNIAKKVLMRVGIDADVVSVVKDERHRPREILGGTALAVTHESSILLANSEAHRFAISRHRRALRKSHMQ